MRKPQNATHFVTYILVLISEKFIILKKRSLGWSTSMVSLSSTFNPRNERAKFFHLFVASLESVSFRNFCSEFVFGFKKWIRLSPQLPGAAATAFPALDTLKTHTETSYLCPEKPSFHLVVTRLEVVCFSFSKKGRLHHENRKGGGGRGREGKQPCRKALFLRNRNMHPSFTLTP